MAADNKSLLADLQRSNRSTLLYKYLLLVILIVVVGLVSSYDPTKQTFQFASIFDHMLAGVVATLLLSIVYDVFTKRQQTLEANVDREILLQQLSREVFLCRGVDALTSDDLKALTKQLTADDQFLRSLAEVTAGSSSFALNMLNAYFRPLWRRSGTEFHAWDNRLIPDPSNHAAYLWKSRLACTRFG